ncbi:MAG: hypothetical protein WBK91_06090 [Alphaproteobacteria bacterium]
MLNPFNQYDGDENRLTHALAITLERSPQFMESFVNLCDAKRLLGKDVRVEIQVVMRSSDGLAETAIPDLLLVDASGRRGLVFEAKVGSSLNLLQLQRHEARAIDYGVAIVGKYAITGREIDAEKIADWKKNLIHKTWQHIAWTRIYEIANHLKSHCEWSKDLADYLGIVAGQRGDKDMDSKVKLTTFTGIPFKNPRTKKTPNSEHAYDPNQAKRHLLALVDNLEEDKKLLADLGFAKDQKPRRRGSIEAADAVWDYLSPLGQDDHHISGYHFTIGIATGHATAMLTIPHASDEFKKLRRFIKDNDVRIFEQSIEAFLIELDRRGLNKAGFQPCIVMKQRRYRTMREVYAIDGSLTFDLRTLVGRLADGKIPAIRKQPEWTTFCYQLLKEKNSNIQFQIGVHFIYGQAEGLHTPEAASFFKDALRATTVFLKGIIT